MGSFQLYIIMRIAIYFRFVFYCYILLHVLLHLIDVNSFTYKLIGQFYFTIFVRFFRNECIFYCNNCNNQNKASQFIVTCNSFATVLSYIWLSPLIVLHYNTIQSSHIAIPSPTKTSRIHKLYDHKVQNHKKIH
jgi:hypothetical protein